MKKISNRAESLLIGLEACIRDAIRVLNDSALGIALVIDRNARLVGVITDGDIRRGLLDGKNLNTLVSEVMNSNPIVVNPENTEKTFSLMRERGIFAVPVVKADGTVVELLHWRDEASASAPKEYTSKRNKVFILAGGKGTRLRPFTHILPKPLIPLGDTPIIEVIMKRFQFFGFNSFVLSLNYRAEMIRAYFADCDEGYNIDYVQEKEFSGTAGSLALLKPYTEGTLLVSNCDIIFDIDIDDFLSFHLASGHDATLVGVFRQVKVPYGVLEISGGELTGMREKPVYDFTVNAGMYAIEPVMIDLLSDSGFIDMPDLLLKAKESGLKVGVYPVSAEMIDVGHLDEYNQATEKARKLGFI